MLQVVFDIKLEGEMLGCLNVFIPEELSLKAARGDFSATPDSECACSVLS